jgi:hypothetical protein
VPKPARDVPKPARDVPAMKENPAVSTQFIM